MNSSSAVRRWTKRVSRQEDVGRASFLDLLITTLQEHEKNLDSLIERLERIVQELTDLLEKVKE